MTIRGTTTASTPQARKTIVRGISQAGPNHTVFVNGGHTYTASLELADGKSLVHKDFAGAGGKAILDDGTNTSAFTIRVTAASGKIDGFTIRGDGGAISAAAPVKVSHDVFDDPTHMSTEVRLDNTTGESKATHDTFIDPTPTTAPSDHQTAIATGTGKATVEHSTFTDFSTAVSTSASGHAKVLDNDISGTHGQLPNVATPAIAASHATVSGNTIHDFAATPAADGIDASDGAVLTGNVITGATAEGVYTATAGAKVTLETDVVIDSAGPSLYVAGAGERVKATNVTLIGTDFGGYVDDGSILKLDSSIVGTGGINAATGGTCSITHSRGPSKHAGGGSGCKAFQTAVDPKFKSDGYHLKGSSPLIDKGNPAKPPKHAKDIDGERRALPGDCGAKHPKTRRDMGADEFKCPSHHHAAAAMATGVKLFHSPSGNIGCAIVRGGGGVARCDIGEHAWQAPPKPHSCHFDWGNGLEVKAHGKGKFVCASDTVLGQGHTLAYGDSIEFAGFKCQSNATSMRCHNLSTRHGFSLSRERALRF